MISRIALLLLALACSAPAQQPDHLYGRWKVTAVGGASTITAMSGAAAGRLMGRVLVLGPKKVQFAGQTCHPTYEKEQESSADFLRDYKADAAALSLPAPITRFDAGCTDVFVRGADKITFTWNGFFLEAVRVVEK